MNEKKYQESVTAPNFETGYQQQSNQASDDDPPQYPQNPVQFEGYTNLGFCTISEPENLNASINPNETRPNFQDVPFLSEDEAREALAKFVAEKCCYGSSPVKSLTFTTLKSSNTYRYILETFTETRKTEYVSEPYRNQPIINNGLVPPQPWDIVVNPPVMFENRDVKVEIPNTAHVEVCLRCSGSGFKMCMVCMGRGSRSCCHCHGHGHRHVNNQRERCFHCHGSGHEGCMTCSRTGRVMCKQCQGNGRLKWFLQLTVMFRNNKDDFIKKTEDIPDEKIRNCIAKNTFIENNIRVYPITHHIDPDVNQASSNLIGIHLSKYSQNSRILSQRHEVNAIPVTLAHYVFNEKNYSYYVYGLDNKVYAPDYPRKCFCCTIL